jgi:small-conductance mechanosensitive channel
MLDGLLRFLDGLPDAEATLAVLVLSFGSAVLVQVVGVRTARRAVARTDSDLDNIAFQELRWPVVVSVALGGVYVLTQTRYAVGVVAQEQLDVFFGKPALSVLVLLWARALNRTVNRFVSEVQSTSRRFEFAPVFSNVFTLVMVVGSLFVVLYVWGIEITPLLGAAGIAGIAVGFAAKDTVANFFGGLSLYFDDTYKIGDYVVLDSGEAGTVVKVGVRSTTLMTRDEVLVTVPNSVLNNARITNQSAPETRKRIRVPVGVAYGTDVDEFEELVLGLAAEETRVIEKPRPRMRFRRFGDSALEYELLCWVRSPMDDKKTVHRLNRAIYKALAEADIAIPYPTRDVNLTAPSPPGPTTNGDAGADPEREPEPVPETGPPASGGEDRD